MSTEAPAAGNTTVPQDASLLDALEKLALTPVTIRGIFLLFTRLHWSNPEHYGPMKAKLGNFIWAKDDKTRTIRIDYDYNYDPKNLGKRPAIFVGTSDFNFLKVVVDNQKAMTADNSAEHFVKMATTSIIIRHIGDTPDESLQLGDMTSQFFLGMRKLIQERLKVSEFEVATLMSSKPFEAASSKADTQFIVDLVMTLKYNAAWLVVREGHRLKTVGYKQSLEDFAITT